MKLDGWIFRIATIVGAFLVSIGLGSMVLDGLGDLLERGVVPVGAANIALLVLFAVLSLLGLLSIRFKPSGEFTLFAGLSPRSLGIALAGTAVVACAALVMASTDSENTSAWRYAKKMQAAADVTKRSIRDDGRHFSRLEIDKPMAVGDSIGAIPVGWKLWIAGGNADMLVRLAKTHSAGPDSLCDQNGTLAVSLLTGKQEKTARQVPQSEFCNQWHRLTIELPRHVTALRFELAEVSAQDKISFDVMILSFQADYRWFWWICTFLAVTALLFSVLVFSLSTRKSNGDVSTQNRKSSTNRSRIFTGVAMLAFVIAGNLFVHWYVAQEKTIYTWDSASYWMSSRNVSKFLIGNDDKAGRRETPAAAPRIRRSAGNEPQTSAPDPGPVISLIRNIRHAEYNIAATLPVAPVMAVLGGSRMVYELTVFNVYAVVAVLLLLFALRAIGRNAIARWPDWWPVIPVLSVLCFVPFWIPIVRGYLGVSVVGLNFAVLWLYFRQPVSRISTPSLIGIGVLLLVGVTMQRWNAYWVIGFILITILDGLYLLYLRRQFVLLEMLRCFRAPIVAGFTAFALFATVAWPKVVTTATTDYADVFSSYLEHAGLFGAFQRLDGALGLGLLVLISAAYLFLSARRSTRRVSILLGVQLLVMFVHFSRTQTMGPHHMYVLMPGMFLLLGLALLELLSSSRRNEVIGGTVALLLIVTNGFASARAVMTPMNMPVESSMREILPWNYGAPLARQDIDEFGRLAQFIDAELANSSDTARFYVLAGSQTLNVGHFRNFAASTGGEFLASRRLLSTALIDKRDGFPKNLFDASLVVAANPVQYSRLPSDHQILRLPSESLYNGTGIGAAFERLPVSFTLDGPVEISIFRRLRPNTAEELSDLSERIKVFYPDRPYVYE